MPVQTALGQGGQVAVLNEDDDLGRRLQWLMFLRVLFTTLLLGATILVQYQEQPLLDRSLLWLYGIIAGTYILTFLYGLAYRRVPMGPFAFGQVVMDTLQATLIIYVAGGYASVFSFLYLVVLTYSSLFLTRRGTLIVAALCSIEYIILIDLEYFGVIPSFDVESVLAMGQVTWNRVVFKMIMTAVACFLVAMLSSLLSEQERATRKELRAVREHMKRVDKMASIGEMAARLAHEIKNPLAALVGSVRLLQDDLPSESADNRVMNIILREADRLNSLVTEFLMFARPAVGNPRAIRLAAETADVVELFVKHDLAVNRLKVFTDVPGDLWTLMDPSHFRQIFWNLLLNSAEAITGAGEIRIRAEASDANVLIRVTDTGGGIDEKVLGRVFEPFFSTKSRGSGLGLSIVYRILEPYGYRLDVESRQGQGSTFTVVARRIPPPGP
ncbi:MAG: ATP-binding protein [Pseudomonadota bacterium]